MKWDPNNLKETIYFRVNIKHGTFKYNKSKFYSCNYFQLRH